jgi:hypothetical protein
MEAIVANDAGPAADVAFRDAYIDIVVGIVASSSSLSSSSSLDASLRDALQLRFNQWRGADHDLANTGGSLGGPI